MPRRKHTTLMIRTPGQLRALRTPMRQRIVETLARLGSCTVKELAHELGVAPASLYYHTHKLVGAGIVERRERAGRTADRYKLCADRIVVDLSTKSRGFRDALVDAHRATIRATEREIARALQEPKRSSGQLDLVALRRLMVHLDENGAAQARQMIDELCKFLSGHTDPSRGRPFSLTVALTPLGAARPGRPNR